MPKCMNSPPRIQKKKKSPTSHAVLTAFFMRFTWENKPYKKLKKKLRKEMDTFLGLGIQLYAYKFVPTLYAYTEKADKNGDFGVEHYNLLLCEALCRYYDSFTIYIYVCMCARSWRSISPRVSAWYQKFSNFLNRWIHRIIRYNISVYTELIWLNKHGKLKDFKKFNQFSTFCYWISPVDALNMKLCMLAYESTASV